MAQNKVELLAGSSNFPRTDNKKTSLVPDPDEKLNRGDNIMTGVATRAVAQLAESSKALTPFFKSVDGELKAIRTELKPNKGILTSLEKIEKHLAKASKGDGEKKAALRDRHGDRKLGELAESMSRNVIITDNIAQNTSYIAHALDQLVRMRDDGDDKQDNDGKQGKGGGGKEPRDAAEEKRNKRLSKTFADSLDNSKMAKEMEKGFKKVSAMQALNSFANAGQGGLKGLLDGTLNSLVGIIGKGVLAALISPLGLAVAGGSIGGILLGLWADRNSEKREGARAAAHEKAQAGISARLSDTLTLGELAREQGLNTEGLGKAELTVHAFEETRKHVESARENSRQRLSKKRKTKLEDTVVSPDDIDFDKDLTKERKIELIALLQHVGRIDHTKYSAWDTFINTATGWDRIDNEDQKQAREYFNEAKYQHFTKKADGYVSASHGANRANRDYADSVNLIQKLKDDTEFDKHKQTGNTAQYRNILPSSDKLWHPEYNNNSVAKQMDDAMEGIHPGLGGGTTAQIMGVESDGTDPVVRCKTVKDAPPPISDTNPYGWWLDEKDGKFRPSTAIGLGQFTAIAMQDMEGVDPEVKAAAKELFDSEKNPYLPNNTDPNKYRNATKYYRAFEKAYNDPEKQIPLFEAHARSKLGAKGLSAIKNLSAEQAKISIIASHKGGGGVLEADGSFDASKHPDIANDYVKKALGKSSSLPKIFSSGSTATESVVGSSGHDYSSDPIAQQTVGVQVSPAVGATVREQSATPSINIGNVDNSQHTTIIQGSGGNNFNDDSGNCRAEFSGW